MRIVLRNLLLMVRHGRQWWYWTPAWQAAEREAQADIAAGRVSRYESGEAFLASLSDEELLGDQ